MNPITAAACRRRLASSGSRSIRAASTAWMVSGIRRVAYRLLCSTTARVSSSRKKGLPAAFPMISCRRRTGKFALCGADCTSSRLSSVVSRGKANCVA